MALVAGAAVVLMAEPSAALAATKAPKATATQGSTFELIADSKAKTVSAKGTAEKAVYGAQKKYVPPSAAKKATPAKKAAASAKKETFKAAAAAPVKFGAVKGATQGIAPAGVTLPTPKGAVTKVATKKAAAPKPAAKKAAAPKPAAPKPVVAAKKAENPLAKKKAAAAGAGAAATAVVVEKAAPVVVEAPAAPAPVPKVKNYVKNTPAVKAAPAPKKALSSSGPAFSLGGDAAEAGAVAAAEVAGVAIATSIVNGILAAPRAARRSA